MRRKLRTFGAIIPLVLLLPTVTQAQLQAPSAAGAASAPAVIVPAPGTTPVMPEFARPDDPWIYRGTDIPWDKEWLFGEIPNGVRYAVRDNGVPPGQVSIRVRIDAGSLYEKDSERGFAHLIEHLLFRQSKYLADGEAIPHFQRLGASLGNDTNAITSPTQTVIQLDLPNARGPVLEDSFRLLAGMIREPTLSEANIRTEVPIVLAERRERGGAQARAADASRELFFGGQLLANRNPIGTVQTLEAANQESVRAFYRRWYRPENAVVVVSGDANPVMLAQLVEKYFGDWTATGKPDPQPDFGTPRAPAGADPANPVGETRVLVEPGQTRSLVYAIVRPWHEVTDNIEYNRGLLLDSIAQAIINRRLEARARVGGTFLFASAERDKSARSTDTTYVSFAPLTADWKSALNDVRGVLGDALAQPPSQAEIDRELAEYDVIFANMAQQSSIQAGSRLADDIVNAVDIREAVAAPDTILTVFRDMRARFTPDEVFAHTQELLKGDVIRALYLTPEAGEADADAVRAAMLTPVQVAVDARSSAEAISFADLPEIGAPANPVSREVIYNNGRERQVERLTFANGVRVLLMPTSNEPGRATVRVRFGGGYRSFTKDEGAYAALGSMALVSSGLGPLGQNELDQIATGRKLGFSFSMDEASFRFEGQTRAEDVEDQLYLFAAKLALPRWDPAPVERAKAASLLSYASLATDPNGVLNRDLDWLLHNRDPRFATPDPDAMNKVTPEGFKQVWSRILQQGPVEVDVFGDIDREKVVIALSRTFGALTERQALPADVESQQFTFPAANTRPLVLNHNGDADQAAAVMAWPIGAGSAGLPQSRKTELLAEVFSNRLMDAMRERAGASYAPYVGSRWPLGVASGGSFVAMAQLPPTQTDAFFAAADKIADDLAANGPTADELARATEPVLQALWRMQSGYTFWMNQLEGGAFDENRIVYLPTIIADYQTTTPAEIKELAARYLGARDGFRLAVLPSDKAGPAGVQSGAPAAGVPTTVGR